MIPAPLISGLANHLWQSTVVAVCIGLLTLALRNNPARLRHILWMVASAKFLIPFSLLIALGAYLQPATHQSVSKPAVSAVLGQITEPFSRQQNALVISEPAASYAPTNLPVAVPPANKWPVAFLAVWILGFLVVVFSSIRKWGVIRAAARTAEPLGEIEDIRMLSSQSLLEPGVFGIFRPVVLLPASIRDRLSDQQLKPCSPMNLSTCAPATTSAPQSTCLWKPCSGFTRSFGT
jgi:beta-lactamase regulating signal transducer with metallopeptidase domain